MRRRRRFSSYVIPGRGYRIHEVDIGPDEPAPGDDRILVAWGLGIVAVAVAVAAVVTYVL